jgi:hypothetical protein
VNTTADDADAVYHHQLARHLLTAHDLPAGWLEGADVEEMECEHAGDHTDPAGLQAAFRDSVPPRRGTIHTHRQATEREPS